MPAKQHHSPDSPSKQDPTERRRLQNRLSQRNHRRKIRDRIAKLQERVIASELRAAASLHGWHSTPCIPYEVKPSPSSSTSSSVSLSPSSSSPPAELQCPPVSYNVGLNALSQLPLLTSQSAYDEVSSIPPNTDGTSSPTTLVPSDLSSDTAILLSSQTFGLETMAMCEQWGFQGSVYVATETSLPQILQNFGPSSNAIIVLPSPGFAGSSMGYTEPGTIDMDICQCHGPGWMSCPLHAMG